MGLVGDTGKSSLLVSSGEAKTSSNVQRSIRNNWVSLQQFVLGGREEGREGRRVGG